MTSRCVAANPKIEEKGKVRICSNQQDRNHWFWSKADTYIDSQVSKEVLSGQLIGRHPWRHSVKIGTLSLKANEERDLITGQQF